MSTTLEEFFKSQGLQPIGTLAHYGIKGMKWGQRLMVSSTSRSGDKAKISISNNTRSPKTAQEAKDFDTAAKSMHSANTKALNVAVKSLNTGSANKLLNSTSRKDYNSIVDTLKKELKSLNPNYQHDVGVSKDGDILVITSPTKKLKHSDEVSSITGTIKLIFDDSGNFIKAEALPSEMVESFLAHYGIKGMKWGFRRTDAQLARAKATTDSPDAIRARTTLSTINKSKSLSSVSDSDLNHLINRINLEKRYSEVKATSGKDPLAKTHSTVKSLLGVGKTLNQAIEFARSPFGRLMASKLNLNQIIATADKAQNLYDVAELKRPKPPKKD